MTIESGCTRDRRVRVSIFFLMCAVFSAYFAYDGYIGYPKINLKWARSALASIKGMPEARDLRTNPKVVLEELRKLEIDVKLEKVTVESLTALFGPPTFLGDEDCCYIGPAAYGWFKVSGGKVRKIEAIATNTEKTESDIAGQKWFAVLTGVVALATLVHLIRIWRARWVLDDEGLTAAGRLIPWDAMDSFATEDYQRKGWLDLVYLQEGRKGKVRLDSFHIDRFDDIILGICERKGFPSPLKPAEEELPSDGSTE
ncbi:MAG TPA: hypothetical protein PKY77_16820 [Phycisphaerae bacterium]|nr:hypothetical protein [Phycisphaerae bacterium]HRY69893.1 hypothetical protein [Phycisphaerae bacterium]HSA29915.1 hypothetical protein [Phycisphaerae bacterium]